MSEKTQRGPHSPAAKKTPKAAKRVAEPETVPFAPMSEKTLRGPHSPAAKRTSKAAESVAKPKTVMPAPPPGGPYEKTDAENGAPRMNARPVATSAASSGEYCLADGVADLGDLRATSLL
jgi:hypothetical protein